MSDIWLGYIFAIISSIFSGIYVVPKKLSMQKPATYAMIMGIGYFIASATGFAFLKTFKYIDEPLFYPNVAIACANGVVWTVASISILNAIDRIGLAKANQWKSLTGPMGAFMMLALLSEFLTAKVIFIFLAIALMTLAAMLFSTRERDNSPIDRKGIAYALTAAVFYAIFGVLSKILTNEGALFSQQIYLSLFVFISSAAYVQMKYKTLKIDAPKIKREILLPLTGGVLFYGNASFLVLAYSHIEGSIVSMLHQLNAVWLFLFGVFVFKEIDFKRYWLRLVSGLVLSVFGVVMLIFAKV